MGEKEEEKEGEKEEEKIEEMQKANWRTEYGNRGGQKKVDDKSGGNKIRKMILSWINIESIIK